MSPKLVNVGNLRSEITMTKGDLLRIFFSKADLLIFLKPHQLGQYPWIVTLGYRFPNESNTDALQFFCSGSLVARKAHFLSTFSHTQAHALCIFPDNSIAHRHLCPLYQLVFVSSKFDRFFVSQ